MFNLAGSGCVGVVAIVGGLIAAMSVAVPLSKIELFDKNDTIALIALAAVFFPVAYFLFTSLRRWDRRNAGPAYARQPETVVISDQKVQFGKHRLSIQSILSVEARHPPGYGSGVDTVDYTDDMQGRARASGYRSGLNYISRCYAIYIRTETRVQPGIAAFGLTMPNARELADVLKSEIDRRRS